MVQDGSQFMKPVICSRLMFWSRNLFDTDYNTEYSTGGFLFKGRPVQWGFDLTKRF